MAEPDRACFPLRSERAARDAGRRALVAGAGQRIASRIDEPSEGFVRTKPRSLERRRRDGALRALDLDLDLDLETSLRVLSAPARR